MAEYLSYGEYLARGGTLAEAEFRACEARARSRVDAMTYGRVRRMAEVPEAVKDAMMVAIGVSAATSALNSFNRQLLSNHIHGCVRRDILAGDDDAIDEFCAMLQKLMK